MTPCDACSELVGEHRWLVYANRVQVEGDFCALCWTHIVNDRMRHQGQDVSPVQLSETRS